MNNFIILAVLFLSSAYFASGSLLDDYKAWKGIDGKASSNGDFSNKRYRLELDDNCQHHLIGVAEVL